jgi:S-adenosylmethionine-diacylglycerol 3-amino-3-carboxypropyl transferase
MEFTQTLRTPSASADRSKELLSNAVFGHKQKATLKERLFAMWFRQLVYTQIWEDPVMDMQALNLGADDHVVTIASGGCNALSYLTANPAKVTAVDLNHAHVSLNKLKIAGLRALPHYDDFFQFFGVAQASSNVRVYKTLIAPKLDADSRHYWEGGPIGFRRIRMFAKGFYKYGLLGQLIGIIHWGAKLHGVKLDELLQQPTQQAQEKWFDEKVAKIFDSKLMAKICSSPFALYNLGIPPSQHNALCDEQPDNMAQVLKERARRLATVVPIQDNYFAWQAFGRRYDATGQSALPPYLMRSHYAQVKANVHKLSVEQSNIRDAIARMDVLSVDAVVLLDAQDWMSNEEITALWREITRAAKPGARVIFRTAGVSSPVDVCFTGDLQGKWVRDDATSDTLGPTDRSGIYGAFHLYRLQA